MDALNRRLGKMIAELPEAFKAAAVEAHAYAVKHAPTSARRIGRLKGGARRGQRGAGGRLRGSLMYGMLRRGKYAVGSFVSAPIGYAKYVERPGETALIEVGTPDSPTTDWPAKSRRRRAGMGRPDQSMPFMSPGVMQARGRLGKRFRGFRLGRD
ncbi:MAG: hypothetical protein ABII76_24720 [Pseudomonadota bacterium]